jgi:glycosyltransferase involved in cell wall biosynthesis
LLANSSESVRILSQSEKNLSSARVIYNGLDLSKFEIQRKNLTEPVPSSAVTDGSRKIVCAVARLCDQKSLDILIGAFAQVQHEFPETQLWLVGDGPQRGDLEILAGNLQIRDKVIFWGLRSDVPAILNYATIGVLSSKVEGLPNAIIEYMAAGLPVVATRVGGNPELVVQGETGQLVPSGDWVALSEALLYLLRNLEVACRFGKAGCSRVQENFTVEQMVKRTETIYQELLDRHG